MALEFDPGLLDFALNEFFNLSLFKRKKAMNMMVKIFNGVIKNPSNEKLKKLKYTKLLEKWGAEVMNAALPLFQVAGFNQINDETGATLLAYTNADTTVLEIVHASLNERVIQENNEIEAKRAAISAQTKKKTSAAETSEARRKRLLKEKMKLGRKAFEAERKTNPIGSSKATKINFGRKDVGVEFDTGDAGG